MSARAEPRDQVDLTVDPPNPIIGDYKYFAHCPDQTLEIMVTGNALYGLSLDVICAALRDTFSATRLPDSIRVSRYGEQARGDPGPWTGS